MKANPLIKCMFDGLIFRLPGVSLVAKAVMTQHQEMLVSINTTAANYCISVNSEGFVFIAVKRRNVSVCDGPPFKVHAPNCDRGLFVFNEYFPVSSSSSHQFCPR